MNIGEERRMVTFEPLDVEPAPVEVAVPEPPAQPLEVEQPDREEVGVPV